MNKYIKSLNVHDLTLLGLITEGGQGLTVDNNGKFVGIIEGSHYANNIIQSRLEIGCYY